MNIEDDLININNTITNGRLLFMSDFKTYGGYIDSDEILTCASGGIATALSEKFIDEGGCVIGVRYKNDFSGAEYYIARKKEELELLKGSKYLDPDTNNIYKETKELLDNGENVLFFGLPCKIFALKFFLRKDYKNLFTCSVICHGPTLNKVHTSFIDYLEKKYKSKIIDFSVRKKKKTWTPYYCYAKFESGKEYYKEFYKSYYGLAFNILGLDRCYNCKYKIDNNVADLQIGDYWGVKDSDKCYNVKGTSCVIAYSKKGNHLIAENPYIILFEIDFNDVLRYNKYIKDIKIRDKRYYKLIKILNDKGLKSAILSTIGIKEFLRIITPNFLKKILKCLSRLNSNHNN